MLGTDKEPGIYVRTLNDLFRAIEETSDDMLYSVSMSYLEVQLVVFFFLLYISEILGNQKIINL